MPVSARILVVDVGGNNVKLLASGAREVRKVPSGPRLTPARMVAAVRKATADWRYDKVAIGFPSPVRDGRILAEPVNLGRGWLRYDLRRGFGRPVRLINDAMMQALGSYRGGRLLFLGLGTGLGSALVLDGTPQPLELAHLPYQTGQTYEDLLGKRGLERVGKKRWRRILLEIATRLHAAFQVDEVVLGGGNSKLLSRVPRGCRLGSNRDALAGGFRLFPQGKPRARRASRRARARAAAAQRRPARAASGRRRR
jgi:predicted NBD/HSP70 family sugar kinase